MGRSLALGWVLITTLCLASCGSADETNDDRLLARVHQKELRLSDLDGMFPAGATREDSMVIVQSFTSRWTKTASLEWEAERNLPPDLNIDRLVRDYRASLVSSHYEEFLIESRIDSNVSYGELNDYYEANKQRYLLERPIVRCLLLRVPYPIQEEEELQALWNNGKITDTLALKNYSERFAEVSLLDQDAWYSLDEIAAQLPPGELTASNINNKQEFSLQEGGFRFYFRLLEVKPRLEVAPLSYVEDQARAMILQNRKLDVLEAAREDIYQRELRKKNIETFPLK
ncbi:peptidylprolyl isomerase [Lewinella sp. 4G2]|uniref:peptidylprolyl isomerase n=1 Tax=Lewinella sp. 4G2 TaxID=1803372 RepID=UPI0007B4930D|nr:peptidylprolyl isomerase [Lewinella sp. 4G2]OAV44662.1 hypothetical protein A3850_009235 [Lewinella sp. 4G2]